MVTGLSTSVLERIVPERAVNVEEFRTIGIVQMFERFSWDKVLDWCEDATPRVYLTTVYEWLASLRFINRDGPANTRQLVGDTGRGQMVMSFEIMNCIARCDSLGIDAYDYYSIDRFFDNKMNTDDPEGMTWSVLPFSDGGAALRSHLSMEGKILQGISLENIKVRFGDRGKIKGPDYRVLHALMFGSPRLS
ncbi:hypothetical protein HanRHA438_Chr11g0495881 [Helianthus annuus]|nr:hypothetical protein HanLR1_Chr11g0396461 [Helianthus annuus]KAJ0870047.1 hypothetical protein HanRHA438_Chr11g0495881 [Helianthus annuus]